MMFRQFITALLVSVLVTSGYYLIAGKKEPGRKFLWSGLIIFGGSWALGLWLQPYIYDVSGFQSASFILSGLVLGLVFILVSLRPPPSGRYETLEKLEQMEKEKDLQKLTYSVLKIVMWFLIFIFTGAFLTRYFFE